MERIDRRAALRQTALIMGGLVFAPNALGILQGCKATPDPDWTPQLFTPKQALLVCTLTDVIIPSGDTPGSTDVGVPAFIEDMITNVYEEPARERFLNGLDRFNNMAKNSYGADFVDLNADQQLEYTLEQNRAAISGEEPSPSFFLNMKELTMMGYFTSEPGATQVLRYVDVPGRYDACIPFEEVGRTWAT